VDDYKLITINVIVDGIMEIEIEMGTLYGNLL
jgi:hypothetical protein